MFKSFLRFIAGIEDVPSPPTPLRMCTDTMFIDALNDAGELVVLEVPAPIRSDLHQGLTSPVVRNHTFLRYDTRRDQT